jgi:hypothetical protein
MISRQEVAGRVGGASLSEVDVGALESGPLLVDCSQGDTKGFELVGDLSDRGSELLSHLNLSA